MFKAILFDLDGTLVNTEPLAWRALSMQLEDFGIVPDSEDRDHLQGRTWDYARGYLFRRYSIGISPEDFGARLYRDYNEILSEELDLVIGASRALQEFSGSFPLGLVTGSRTRQAHWILDRLKIREHFQIVVAAEDYLNPKPHPESYELACSRLAIRPSDALVFEDSWVGLAAARSAGALAVAVGGLQAPGGVCIPDFSSVDLDWLKRLFEESGARVP